MMWHLIWWKILYIHRPICIMYIEWTMCLTVRRAHCLYYMYRHSAQLGLRFSLWGYSICSFPIIGWFHGYLGHANPFAFSRSDCIRWSVTFNIHDTFFFCWILTVYRSKFNCFSIISKYYFSCGLCLQFWVLYSMYYLAVYRWIWTELYRYTVYNSNIFACSYRPLLSWS